MTIDELVTEDVRALNRQSLERLRKVVSAVFGAEAGDRVKAVLPAVGRPRAFFGEVDGFTFTLLGDPACSTLYAAVYRPRVAGGIRLPMQGSWTPVVRPADLEGCEPVSADKAAEILLPAHGATAHAGCAPRVEPDGIDIDWRWRGSAHPFAPLPRVTFDDGIVCCGDVARKIDSMPGGQR